MYVWGFYYYFVIIIFNNMSLISTKRLILHLLCMHMQFACGLGSQGALPKGFSLPSAPALQVRAVLTHRVSLVLPELPHSFVSGHEWALGIPWSQL